MKFIYTILFFLTTQVSAMNYYFSSSTGNDNGAGTITSPYKTLTKATAIASIASGGDSLLFKCGDVFFGQFSIANGGIIVSSYNTGAQPIFNGLQTLSNFSDSSNIWTSTINKTGDTVNFAFKNGIQQRMGRYPNYNSTNGGYLSINAYSQSASGAYDSTVSNGALVGGKNWTGANVICRVDDYTFNKGYINNFTDSTLWFNGFAPYNVIQSLYFGFFIQNDLRTLDTTGEWYCNNTLFRMYLSTPDTSDIQIPMVDTLVKVYGTGVQILNVSIQGANDIGIWYAESAGYATVKNTSLNYNNVGIYSDTCHISITGTNVNHSSCMGMYLRNSGSGYLAYDTVRNTGLIEGSGILFTMVDITYIQLVQYSGIFSRGCFVNHCLVDSSGYCGIQFYKSNSGVDSSTVSNFGITKSDVGGIYTFVSGTSPITFSGQQVLNNIVYNGYGNYFGTPSGTGYSGFGIYMDNETNNIQVLNNTIFNCNFGGLFGHDMKNSRFSYNNIYNCGQYLSQTSLSLLPSQISLSDGIYTVNNENDYDTITHNICVTGNYWQTPALYENNKINNTLSTFGIIDSNYYISPTVNNVPSVQGYENLYNDSLSQYKGTWQSYDSLSWIQTWGYDVHSKWSALNINGSYVSGNDGINSLLNNSFASNINGLTAIPQIGTVHAYWDTAHFHYGSAKIISTSDIGVSNYQVYMLLSNYPAGVYQCSFNVQAAKDSGTFYVASRSYNSPYSLYSTWQQGDLNTNNTTYTYVFYVSPGSSSTTSALSIVFTCPPQTIYFSNPVVAPVYGGITNSLSYSSILYNNTSIAKTYTLTSTYYDVNRNSYSGSITLQPYSSIILFNYKIWPPQPTGTTTTITTTGKINLVSYE